MKGKEQKNVLRQNFLYYTMGVLILLGMKLYYRQADCDSLLWILTPTTRWVELLSGIPFTYLSGTGYVNHDMRLLIAPSCSGFRFMTIAFATLYFSFIHRIVLTWREPVSETVETVNRDSVETGLWQTRIKGVGWIVVSVLLSWLFTVIVNGLRIIAAIYLPLYLEDTGIMGGTLTQDSLHTMIGVVVYFIALLTIYRLAGCLIQRTVNSVLTNGQNSGASETVTDTPSATGKRDFVRTFAGKCAAPVFWYFALTLGLPFLNRVKGGRMAGFQEFAMLVMGCCVLILASYFVVHFLGRRKNKSGGHVL